MPFTNNTEEDWDRAVRGQHQVGLPHLQGASRRYFIERKAGRIINIASIAGPLAAPTMPAYSRGQGGRHHLHARGGQGAGRRTASPSTRSARACSGPTSGRSWPQHIADTNPAFKGMTARQVFDKRVGDVIPMKREQTPEDIGWAAVFLASDEARNITGQALMVDGGCVMIDRADRSRPRAAALRRAAVRGRGRVGGGRGDGAGHEAARGVPPRRLRYRLHASRPGPSTSSSIARPSRRMVTPRLSGDRALDVRGGGQDGAGVARHRVRRA